MPLTYRVNHELGIVEETWTGTVTADALREFWARYLDDPEVRKCGRSLSDIRQAVIDFRGDELAAVIRTVVIPRLGTDRWRSAILVDNAVQFGLGRQYHAFAERYSTDAIFEDRDEARAWLLQGKANG